MCSKLLKVLVLSLISVAACSDALAGSCMLLSAHDRYQNADAVFVGTAVSTTDSAGHVRFHIEESFSGTTGDSIVVKHYDPIISDSFAFRVGEKYLVVAYRQKDELTVGSCNQGAGIKLATGDVHVLRAQLKGNPLPYVYGVVTRKDGEPLANARVTLHSDAHPSQVAAETRTGSDGYFEFWIVSPGGYSVIATPAGGGSPIKDSFGTGFPGVRLIMHDW
jgi:hypothetical protein